MMENIVGEDDVAALKRQISRLQQEKTFLLDRLLEVEEAKLESELGLASKLNVSERNIAQEPDLPLVDTLMVPGSRACVEFAPSKLAQSKFVDEQYCPAKMPSGIVCRNRLLPNATFCMNLRDYLGRLVCISMIDERQYTGNLMGIDNNGNLILDGCYELALCHDPLCCRRFLGGAIVDGSRIAKVQSKKIIKLAST